MTGSIILRKTMIWIFRRPDGKGNSLCRLRTGVACSLNDHAPQGGPNKRLPQHKPRMAFPAATTDGATSHFARVCSSHALQRWKSRCRSNVAFCI